MSCCVQEDAGIVDGGESQGVMLCPGGRDNSGQGRVTRCHAVSKKA